MAILYVPRKKVDKSGETPKELYYAVPKAFQRRGVPIDEKKLAESMEMKSSLTAGDVKSVLTQLPREIAEELKNGRTVNIEGLGTFYLSISSEGVEKPEDCKASTIKSIRICFRAAEEMKKLMANCEFKNVMNL